MSHSLPFKWYFIEFCEMPYIKITENGKQHACTHGNLLGGVILCDSTHRNIMMAAEVYKPVGKNTLIYLDITRWIDHIPEHYRGQYLSVRDCLVLKKPIITEVTEMHYKELGLNKKD